MSRIKFKIYTLGCKVNQYDSSDLAKRLKSAGFELARENAQIAIVNTCAVTKTAISKGKRIINKARKENPPAAHCSAGQAGAKIILMGCWPKVYREEADKLEVDLVWEVGELDELIEKIFNFQFSISKQIPNSKFQIPNSDKSRYFLKIQDGCEQFCSYCIIPYARGKMRSRGEAEIIKETKDAIKAGYREIVLCGIHLGLYGLEGARGQRGGKEGLIALLEKLIKIKGLGRIRLSSIEANEVTDDLIKLIKNSKGKICQHLHIPLQSGSDKILKLMNRPYSITNYEGRIKKIRKLMPDIAITADVIAGFPGETAKDFKKTYEFVKKINFSRLHVFPFSAHEKTPAAKLPGRVEVREIKKRAEKLKNLGEKLANNYKKKFKGRKLEVVVERKISSKKYLGKTEFYFDVGFEGDFKTGEIVKVKI